MSVTTPEVLDPHDAKWLLEVLDDNPLPVNTNDQLTPGFQLVKQTPFRILAPKSPPMSRVPVEVSLDPKETMPNELLVVAPLDFNFTDDCLVESGTGDVALDCQ